MRKLITITLLLSFIGSFAQNNSKKDLTGRICGGSYLALSGSTPIKSFENVILSEIGVEYNDPERIRKISEFLNENYDNLICGGSTFRKIRDYEHVFKRMIASENYIYIEYLAENEDLYSVNLNLFEMVNGKKETILDYVEMIIAEPIKLQKYNEKVIFELRDMFIDMGLKRGVEL